MADSKDSKRDPDPGRVVGEFKTRNTSGEVRISDDVVGVIAGIAAAEIDGIAGMSGGFVGGISEMMLGKKNLSKGVRVDSAKRETSVDLYVVVDYGVQIPVIARKIQENVKKAVESMTGLKVKGVNIHVQGVSFPGGEMAPKGEQVK